MNAVARMAVLDARTVAPYRAQGIGLVALVILLLANRPAVLLPALVLLAVGPIAAYPFNIADKGGLDTLYAVLPLPHRAVLLGRYAWALACYVVALATGTAAALVLARAQSIPLDGRTLGTAVTVSWALFAVNVAVQFPLLIRFGYNRVSVLSTTLPLGIVMVLDLRLHLTIADVQSWLPWLWPAGAIALGASAALAAGRFPAPGGQARRRDALAQSKASA